MKRLFDSGEQGAILSAVRGQGGKRAYYDKPKEKEKKRKEKLHRDSEEIKKDKEKENISISIHSSA